MSHGLDPDQDRRSVGPDLGPNCLQRLELPIAIKVLTFDSYCRCTCFIIVADRKHSSTH